MSKRTIMTIIEFLSNFWFLAFMAFMINCSKGHEPIPQIKCNVCNSAIVIDGFGDEWINYRSKIINNNTSVGVCKDDAYLYVHLITSDPELSMQIMNFGLTIWFDAQGTQKKKLGVQFPIVQFVPPPPRDGEPPAGDELQSFLNERLKSIALHMPGSKQAKSIPIDEANKYSIDANIGIEEGILSYELKYPLHSTITNSMGLNLDSKPRLKICIETPKVDFNKMMVESGDNKKPPQGMKPPEGQYPPKGVIPQQGQQPPQGVKPPDRGAPPKGQEPSGVERLQEVSNQNLRPKPPQITRISQWIEVTF